MSMEQSRQNETNSSDLAKRLGTYGARVVDSTRELPDTKQGRHIRDQLLRAGTAPGAHYAEARSAQSDDDFVHKLALAAKEARESLYWLRVVDDSRFFDCDAADLIEEADEIVAILFSSLHTARHSGDEADAA